MAQQNLWSLRMPTSLGESAWDRMGGGPPVVLVHGTPTLSLLWRRVAPVLSERCSVHLYDLLGYGECTRREDDDVSIAVQGRARALLDWVGQSPRARPDSSRPGSLPGPR